MNGKKDRELDEEVRAHLAMATRERIERGESVDQAAVSARREFGSVALVQETTREMWGWAWFERVFRDVAYGLRLLRRAPAFSVVAIVTLAIGIGVNTAIFEVINAIRLSALPVARPFDLAEIAPASMEGARGNFPLWGAGISNPIWEALRDRQQAFSGVFAWGPNDFNLATGGEVRRAKGIFVSGGLFDVLGVRPVMGRLLGAADDVRGCETRAALSYAFWQREYGGDPGVVGRTLTLESHVVEIVGVSEQRFFGLEVGQSFDVAVPICSEPTLTPDRANTLQPDSKTGRLDSGTDWWLMAMGRLKPGTTVEQASAHVQALSPGIFESTLKSTYPGASKPKYLEMKLQALPAGTGVSELRERYEMPLWMLLALAAVVLMIACANLANLMLARATARGRGIAIRLSLGASRSRVMGQLMTESLVLAAAGAASGVALARVLSSGLTSFVDAGQQTLFLGLTLDWHVLTFAAGLAALTSALFGLAPAIRATGFGPVAALRIPGRGMSSSRQHTRVRSALIVTQVGLSFVLIVAALLFRGTMNNLAHVDPGFSPDGVVFTTIDFRTVPVPEGGILPYRRLLLERIRAIPGIEQAATAVLAPATGDMWGNSLKAETPSGPMQVNALMNRISERYFDTLHIPLIAGRDFGSQDVPTAPRVAIVNDTLARTVFPGGPAVGRRFTVEQTPSSPATEYEIVGVVADSKYENLQASGERLAYFPMTQQDGPATQFVMIASKSRIDLTQTTAAIASTLHDVNPGIALSFRVFRTEIERTLSRERLMATLSLWFGIMAALLAMAGLYGIIAYTITQRTNEIGVRRALGASSLDVLRMILRDVSALVAVGLMFGFALALAFGRAASSLLFGLGAYDPASMATAVVLLVGVALIASLVPAQAAMRIEPTVALRTGE